MQMDKLLPAVSCLVLLGLIVGTIYLQSQATNVVKVRTQKQT